MSVSDRLTRSLLWIGLIGGVALIVSIAVGFHRFVEQAPPPFPWRTEVMDITEDVVLPIFFIMVPMYLAARRLIRKSLTPLGEAAARIDSAHGNERGFRLDLADLPAEALPFGRAVNELLGRLDVTAERRELFSANVAHELKTPLSILMLELDRLDIPEAGRLKADVQKMSRLLDQILLMAQLDAQAIAPTAYESVDLADIVGDVVLQMAPVAVSQNKQLAFEVLDHCAASGWREALAAAIRNLIENALRVTPPQGVVTVLVGPGAEVRVRDGGLGLTAETLARLSQPFARGDHASPEGAGLGLAIVSRILADHGGGLGTDPGNRELHLWLPGTEGSQA